MKKDEELLPDYDKVEMVQKEIFKREAAMRALEDIHNACDEICDMAEKRVEWGLTDYTTHSVGVMARNILWEASLKIRCIANESVKIEFPDLNIDTTSYPAMEAEVNKLLGRC